MNDSREALRIIEKGDCILIGGHKDPDGDSLGSTLALYHILKEHYPRKRLIPYSPTPIPRSLLLLPGAKEVIGKIGWYPDVIVGLDYGDFARLEIPIEYTQGVLIITFDHHPFSAQRGDARLIDTSYSSTSELLYYFAQNCGWKINQEAAQCLLTGIFTDTGGFVHNNTSYRTLKAAGELVRCGASLPEIYRSTFASKSPQALNIWGEALRRIVYHPQLFCVYAGIPNENLQRFNIEPDELSGLVSILNQIPEGKFSLLLIEWERGRVKGSLRSEAHKRVDVAKIAQALGGGGHKYAAGFEIEAPLEEAEEFVFAKIEKVLASSENRQNVL